MHDRLVSRRIDALHQRFLVIYLWGFLKSYCTNPKYADRQACANSPDSDQTPKNATSDQGLHCLPLIQ